MECINFDERFEQYAAGWMRDNAAKYKNNLNRMEAAMPDVYLKWLNQPADWLGGESPGAYFIRFDSAEMLVEWMIAYFARRVPVPDQLLERLTSLGADAEGALLRLLENDNVPEEARLTTISLLSEMESRAPMARYIAWIAAARNARDERAEMAAEALGQMGGGVVAPVLEAVKTATAAGREAFADVLCNYPGDPLIYDLTLSLFHTVREKRALYASLLGKLGDERAIPVLSDAMRDDSLNYLDYIELRNAVEALGGDPPPEREFSGDPYYESLRRME